MLDWKGWGEKKPRPKPTPTRPVTRKERSDKRVRSTLRISREMHEMIITIAFNHGTSKQRVIDSIIHLVLGNDILRSQLIHSMPKAARHTYIFTDANL